MHRDHPAMPFAAVLTGIATFSLMDALMKNATLAVGAYNAMLFRSLFAVVLIYPLWKLRRGTWPKPAVLRLHIIRGAISAAMATTFFWGLARMPLADAMALSFIAPLIALYLAAVSLGEKVEAKAIAGSLLGFAGVLVIAAGRLGQTGFDREMALGIGAILISAVLYAFNLILMRKQAQVASPQEVALFQAGFAGMFLLLAAPWLAVLPDSGAAIEIFAGAALAMVSLMLVSWGYARAEAQALLPLEYSAFIWAALLGWLMFAETVTLATISGVMLIVAGCWIAARPGTAQSNEQVAL
jgi:S-adenosylmethionine uptake transporter